MTIMSTISLCAYPPILSNMKVWTLPLRSAHYGAERDDENVLHYCLRYCSFEDARAARGKNIDTTSAQK